jgi:CubicO group peptidase (beta-lactamase class C family)
MPNPCPSVLPVSVVDERLAAVDALFAPYNRADAPGCVVGIAWDGRLAYRKAFGLASVRHGVANTPRSRMRIGSTSKHFTCLAALMLAEEGRLDLDAPVSQALPDLALPALQGQPTLRQFMSHTSGWRCALDLSLLGNGSALMPQGWMPAAVARQRGVNFAPGHGQIYSNSGYHLLSMAIDLAAGMPLEAFLRQRVFAPLGMHDTEGVPSDTRVTRDMVSNHVPDPAGGWRHAHMWTEEIRGEGNLVSTVGDMLCWLAHLRGPKQVGSEAAWRQLLEPTDLADGTRSPYGLGLVRREYRGLEVIEHAGGVAGGNSQMLTVPAHALDIVLMSNGLLASMRDLAPRIIDILLVDHLGPEAARASLANFQHLVGARYHGPSGRTISFGAVGDHLGLSFLDNPPFAPLRDEGEHLRLRFEDTATCDLWLRVAELAAQADGQPPATIELRDAGHLERLVRLPVTAPAPEAAGAPLRGPWVCHDLPATAEIVIEGEALVLWLRGDYSARRRLCLTPLSDKVFGVADPGLPMGGRWVLTRDDDGGTHATRFTLDGPRTRHLSFERPADPTHTSP